jgi:hypothetical protein
VQETNLEEIKKSLRQEGCSLEHNAGQDLSSGWGNFSTNDTDSLFWRWKFQGISPLVLSFFLDVGLVQPSDSQNKAQWAMLVCQPDVHSRQHVFPNQIHTTHEDGSSRDSILKAVTSGTDISPVFQDMIFFPYSKTDGDHNNPLSPIELAGLDCLLIKGTPNAHQLSTSDVKHAFRVLVGGEVEKYVPEGLPKDNPVVLFRALLLSVQKSYSGLGTFAMVLKLIKRLVLYGSLRLSPDQAQSFLEKIQVSHQADAYFLAMLSFSAEINCKLACVQGKSRILATKLAAINCVPANGAENLLQPVSFGKNNHVNLRAASSEHFIITLIASDPSNAQYSEEHNKILRQLSLTHQTNQNLAHQPCLRDFLVGIICKLKTKSDRNLISAFPHLDLTDQKKFKDSVVKQRKAAASFIYDRFEENVEVKEIVLDFLRHSQAQTNLDQNLKKITTAAADRPLMSCAGKAPRARSLNWLINLATQFTINAEAMEVFFRFLLISDKLDMLPSGNPLSRTDTKGFPAKWNFFFKIRESLTCSIYGALNAKTKNFSVAFKHRIRLSLSASILKVIMEKDSLDLNTENYYGFANVSAKLSSKLKGNETLCITSIFLELLCKVLSDGTKNECDSLQLSDEFDNFLGASSLQLSHTIPPLKLRLTVGGPRINDDSPVYDLWHFTSAVLPKPNEYPAVWGLLNKAAETVKDKSGPDGGKTGLNGTPDESDLGSVDTTEQNSTPESSIDQPLNTDGAGFVMSEAIEDNCTEDEEEMGDPPSASAEEGELTKREAVLLKNQVELEFKTGDLLKRNMLNTSNLEEIKKSLDLRESQLILRESQLKEREALASQLRESCIKIKELEMRVKSLSAHKGTKESLFSDARTPRPPRPRAMSPKRNSRRPRSMSPNGKSRYPHPLTQITPPNDDPPSATRSEQVTFEGFSSDDSDNIPITPRRRSALSARGKARKATKKNKFTESVGVSNIGPPTANQKSNMSQSSDSSDFDDLLATSPFTPRSKSAPTGPQSNSPNGTMDEPKYIPDTPVATKKSPRPAVPENDPKNDSSKTTDKSVGGLPRSILTNPSTDGRNVQPAVSAPPCPPTRRNRNAPQLTVGPQKRASPNENQSCTKRKKLLSDPSGGSDGELTHLYPDEELWKTAC